MKHKAASAKKDSLRLFVLFCGVVALLILSSVLIKTFYTVRDSRYDASHAYVLSFVTKNGAVFYNIDPQKKEFSALRVAGSHSQLNPGRDLGIPVDSSIYLTNQTSDDVRLKSILPTLIFRSSPLTWYDMLRLVLTTSRMNEDTQRDAVMQYPLQEEKQIELDTRFYDQDVVTEGATISIVNATSVSGVGSRLETVLSNLGGSVISVTTAPRVRKDSVIEYNDPSLYTVAKLQKLLNFPSEENAELTASDIMVIIGEDGLESPKF